MGLAITQLSVRLAARNAEVLSYVGSAFLGLPLDAKEDLQIRLAALGTDQAPIAGLRSKTAQWAKPELVVRVRHLAGPKRLRHATVKSVS